MANDTIQTGGPPYPNFNWPYPTAPSTAIQLVAVGSDTPHWTGQHKLSTMAYGSATKDGGGFGSGQGGIDGGFGKR
jgi:hypothetical protein